MSRPDEPTFAALVRAQHAAVYRAARRVLHHDAEAQDVAQQVFVLVLEGKVRLEEAREPERLLCWLAVREALTAQRKARRRGAHEEFGAMLHEKRGADALEDPLQDAEQAALLSRELARLPEELRVALVLRYEQELHFEEIAEATGVSIATAHQRVERALERLRRELTRSGCAAMVACLPEALARRAPPLPPAGLETRLLSLWKTQLATSGFASALGWTLGALASVVLVVVGLRVLDSETQRPLPAGPSTFGSASASLAPAAGALPTRTAASTGLASAERSSVNLPPTADGTSSAPPSRTRVCGRVVDAQGRGLEGVLLEASQAWSKAQWPGPWGPLTTRSAASGAFALEVPVAEERAWRLSAELEGYRRWRGPGFSLEPGADYEHAPIELLPDTGALAGDFSLLVDLRDPSGAPVPSARVQLWRAALDEWGRAGHKLEVEGQSDASGLVRLEGHWLGEKLVRVQVSDKRWAPAEVELALAFTGVHDLRVALEPGRRFAGRVRTLDGEVPAALSVGLGRTPGNPELWATSDAAGSFAFEGLSAGPYALTLCERPWSRVELLDLQAPTEDFDLLVKRWDDPREGSHHMAEIHGELVDAHSGTPVLAEAFDVRAVWLGGLDWEDAPQSSADLARFCADELPNRLAAPTFQTMLSDPPPPPRADVHLDGLGPGWYLLSARVGGYGPGWSVPLRLEANQLRSGVRLELAAPASVEGRVFDAQGRPAAFANVLLTGSGPRSEELSRALQAALDNEVQTEGGLGSNCDAQGRFRFEQLPAGLELVLIAQQRGARPGAGVRVLLEAGELRTVDLELR